MKRRGFLRLYLGGGAISVAGCNGFRRDDADPSPVLDIFAEIHETEVAWELTARVRNTHDWDVSIHNVTLLAFSKNGTKVCQNDVGDLIKLETKEQTVTISCSKFPAIITAKAEETPCDGAQISLLIWQGTEQQKSNPNDPDLWEHTRRKCNEPLPPERAL